MAAVPLPYVCQGQSVPSRGCRHVRRGVAQLELVLVFPLLVLMVATFFLLLSGMVTRVETAVASHYKTFQSRYPHDGAAAEADDVISIPATDAMKRVFGTQPRGASGEPMIAKKESRVPDSVLRVFDGVLGPAEVKNYVLFDPWDFRALPFEQHARLTIGERAAPFGLSAGHLRAFQALQGTSYSEIHDASVAAERDEVKKSRQESETGRRQIEDELRKLRDKLQTQLDETPVDEGAVRELRDEIERLQRLRDGFNDGIRQLKQATQTLSE